MPTTSSSDPLTEYIQGLAATHVKWVKDSFNLDLDYSESSFEQIDRIISQSYSDGSVQDAVLLNYGAYVGEAIRAQLGGVWTQDANGTARLEQIGGVPLTTSPFGWVQNRFANGQEDSIAFKFSALKQNLAQQGGTMPASDASAESQKLLSLGPLLVFAIVSAADGKIDRKEFEAFARTAAQFSVTSSPLMKSAIEQMRQEIETRFEELSEGRYEGPPELRQLGIVLDQQYPQESATFKQELMALAVKVASASGGVFGFGNKISKEEAGAIYMIATTLGTEMPEI